MTVNERINTINKEIESLNNIIDEKMKNCDISKFNSFKEYEEYTEVEYDKIGKLSREKRLIMPYELSELPDYGDLMSLKEFISCAKSGGFIDYDGFGYYVKDNMETNIVIKPSDVIHKSIRKDFDKIIWFNK